MLALYAGIYGLILFAAMATDWRSVQPGGVLLLAVTPFFGAAVAARMIKEWWRQAAVLGVLSMLPPAVVAGWTYIASGELWRLDTVLFLGLPFVLAIVTLAIFVALAASQGAVDALS